MRHVAVVGGSVAGVSAVESLRDHGFTGRITLLDGENCLPYDKPPLSKAMLSGEAVSELHPGDWYDAHGVTLRLGDRVTGVDTSARSLRLATGDLGYDGLVIATGSAARGLPVPSHQPERIHRVRTLTDSYRLRADLVPGRHLVIVGAGFIGLEVAAAARQAGLEVTVLEAAPTPLHRAFGGQLGQWFARLHERNGVVVRCGVKLREIVHGPGGFVLKFAEGPDLPADVVLAGVGAAPQTGWLDNSGIQTGNGVRCGRDLRTNVPGVVAAGDVAHWHNALFAEDMRIEHWTNAVEQGRHAARTLLGERDDYRAVPYFWTDQYDAKVRFVGRADAGDEIVIDEPKPNALIALFGRGGVIRGAVCVNAPRRLAQYRKAIYDRRPWTDVIGELAGDHCTPTYTRGVRP